MKGKLAISPYFPFPADLVERVEELDLGLESLFMSWEIAALAGEQEPELRRAITILALACLLLLKGIPGCSLKISSSPAWFWIRSRLRKKIARRFVD